MGYLATAQSLPLAAQRPADAPVVTSDDLRLAGQLMAAMRSQMGETTVMHSRRVAAISALLAERLEMERAEIWLLWIAAHLHDVGKLDIDRETLRAPRALTQAERAVVERHALAGSRMLTWRASSPLFRTAARIAETHHERYDGGGYPRGLSGTAIPLAGRVVAVADVFDALLSDRPYRPALALSDAAEVMAAGRGSHFDPRVLDSLFADLTEALAIRSTVGAGPGPFDIPSRAAPAPAGAVA